jgi:hypothetical protein
MTEELLAVLALDLEDAATLYERCYARDCRAPAISVEEGEDLQAALAAANQSRDRWDDTWRVVQALEEGRVMARSGRSARPIRAGQYITLRGPGVVPEEDEPIRVFQPAGTPNIQESFYFAFGETVNEHDEFESLVRFYWNISRAGAPLLMAAITGQFNRFSVPFRFKCGQQPSMFERRDSAVLYVSRSYYSIAAQLVEQIHQQLADHLRDSVPLFTRPLARGLALAEDTGESFGQSRCAILAEAMAASRGWPAPERLQALGGSFESRRLSLAEPWRNAGSHMDYRFPFGGG